MIKDNQRIINRVNIVLDVALAFASMLLAHWIRFTFVPGAFVSVPFSVYVRLAGISAVLHLCAYSFAGLYRLQRRSAYRLAVGKILLCELACMLVLISGLFVLNLMDISRWTIIIDFLLQMLFMVGKETAKRAVLHYFRRKGYNQKHIVVIGSGESARNYARMVQSNPQYGYRLDGYCATENDWDELPYLGDFENLEPALREHNPDEAVIALRSRDYVWMARVIHACEQSGTRLQIVPCYDKYISSTMEVETLEGINLINIRRVPLELVSNAFAKRATDILGATLALIVFSPLMLVAAVGTRLSSPGPIIFKQERIGKNKRPFQMYKFRSMRVNAREQTGWSGQSDDRRTAFGSFLRKYSIDELPQLFNVLRGSMSLVGPRPEVPYYVEQFRDEIPLYMIKHYVRPGMTGWAQVNGLRGDTSIRERVEHDVYYIENWTWGFDFRILLMTVLHLKNDETMTGRIKK